MPAYPDRKSLDWLTLYTLAVNRRLYYTSLVEDTKKNLVRNSLPTEYHESRNLGPLNRLHTVTPSEIYDPSKLWQPKSNPFRHNQPEQEPRKQNGLKGRRKNPRFLEVGGNSVGLSPRENPKRHAQRYETHNLNIHTLSRNVTEYETIESIYRRNRIQLPKFMQNQNDGYKRNRPPPPGHLAPLRPRISPEDLPDVFLADQKELTQIMSN